MGFSGRASHSFSVIVMGVAHLITCDKRRLGLVGAVCATLFVLWLPSVSSGFVEVHVTRAGFPTLQQGDVVRSGAWVPLIVDLALTDQQSFDGSVRVAQFDDDGDECYDRVDVHLRGETGGTQRLYLYALPNTLRNQGRFVVELFSDEGEPVKVVSQGELTFRAEPALRPVGIADDEVLILSVSTGTIGRVQDLVAPDRREAYSRPLHVGHVSPADLPELWIGLETVDIIVWDEARPEDLTERQLNALLEWVRQGGTLLIAASRTAGSLRLTDSIDAILPLKLGDVLAVLNLPDVRKALLTPPDEKLEDGDDVPWWEVPFDAPVPCVQGTLRVGAWRVPNERGNDSNVVTRGRVGRGHVIFSAVTLKDLFRGGGSAVDFFQELFHLRVLGAPDQAPPRRDSLFSEVTSAIAFATSGSLYLLVAAVFSVGYVLVATFGSWSILGARGWRRHSWTFFALVGIAASLLSVVAVNSLRGFGETLHQITVVDVDAGDPYGYATALFGLKTGTDRRLDLWLPSDPLGATDPTATACFLRPIPSANDALVASTGLGFADPEEYRLVPASAVIDDVRIRATLKQFEGRWVGVVGGTMTGEITVKGLRILEGSYIVNNLGVDLEGCYLLHPVRDPARGTTGSRSADIYAYPIGTVRSDGLRIDLVSRCYQPLDDETVTQVIMRSTLANAQTQWGSEFRSVFSGLGSGWGADRGPALGQEKNALLLLTTVGEHDPKQDVGMTRAVFGPQTWSRDRLRRIDLADQLMRDSVILVGFAADPGPVRLFRRAGDASYRRLEPDPEHSWTMYRIRIPVTLRRTAGEEAEDDESEKGIQ